MKKSQITAFILIGIIIVIIFGLVITLKGATKTKAPEKQPIEIKTYVQQCFEQAFYKGLLQISEQGGFIFRNQNYSMLDFDVKTLNFTYLDTNSTIQFLIMQPDDVLMNEYYPCLNVPNATQVELCHRNYNHTQTLSLGSFGHGPYKIIPELCNEKNTSATYFGFICDCIKCRFTIQQQLEHYINERTKECLSSLSIFNETGYAISASDLSSLSSKVEFGNQRTRALLRYNISVGKGEKKENVGEFVAEVNSRVKPIFYDIIMKAAINDITNISYDMLEGMKNIAIEKNYPALQFEKFRDGYGNTIYVINDSKGMIGGKPYYFKFAVENRKPAIDYFYIPDGNPDTNSYDIYVTAGAEIKIQPVVFDPDEDTITIEYSGWKADYDEVWDEATRNIKRINIQNNKWHSSSYYVDGCYISDISKVVTENCASVKTEKSDYGFHEVTITAKDPYGLSDSQKIRIFVTDVLVPTIVVENYYPDIPNEYVSNEDRFYINGTSASSNRVEYYLKDLTQPSVLDTGWKENVFTEFIPGMNALKLGEHIIELKARKKGDTFSEVTVNKTIYVVECLPHKSSIPSIPYNNIVWFTNNNKSTDDFASTHSCCNNDYTFKKNTDVCFSYNDLGDYSDTVKNRELPGTVKYVDENGINLVLNGSADPRWLYNRIYTAYCTGTSGKMCSNNITYTMKVKQRCNICQKAMYNYQSCFNLNERTPCGPPACSTKNLYNITIGTGAIIATGACDGQGNCSMVLNVICEVECNPGDGQEKCPMS